MFPNHQPLLPDGPVKKKRTITLLNMIAMIGIGALCVLGLAQYYHGSPSTHFTCSFGYESFEKTRSCYKASLENLYFYNAHSRCKMEGGHLASIHSREEDDFVAELFQKELRNRVRGERYYDKYTVWVGLIYHNMTRDWTWTDGSPFDYQSIWRAPYNPTKTIGAIEYKQSQVRSWKTATDEARPFICKKAGVPTTSFQYPSSDVRVETSASFNPDKPDSVRLTGYSDQNPDRRVDHSMKPTAGSDYSITSYGSNGVSTSGVSNGGRSSHSSVSTSSDTVQSSASGQHTSSQSASGDGWSSSSSSSWG